MTDAPPFGRIEFEGIERALSDIERHQQERRRTPTPVFSAYLLKPPAKSYEQMMTCQFAPGRAGYRASQSFLYQRMQPDSATIQGTVRCALLSSC
jgi:hypothetical protein